MAFFEPETGQKISRFGAALGGKLPAFDKQIATRKEELSAERKEAFLLDNRGALRALRAGRPQDAVKLFQNRIGEVERLGGDSSQSVEILSMLEANDIEGVTAGLEAIDNRAVDAGIFKPFQTAESAGKASAVTKVFQNGTVVQALPNGKTAVKDPEGNEVTGDARLATLKAAQADEISFERTKSGAKAAGSAAITQSTKAFEQLGKIKTSISNMDIVIDLIDKGAKTGPIMSKLPSIRSASVALDNAQKAMGLDVIGTTTFGALSKGELDLALSKALPTGLRGPALREWVVAKKSAQEKLAVYLEDVAIFLGTEGNTVAQWLKAQKELSGPNPSASAPGGQPGLAVQELSDEELLNSLRQ